MDSRQITYPPALPVSERREEILKAIAENQVVIIAGATGSGKTTQIPKMCLELGKKSIAHTQPRRIAARAVAERIAEELGVDLGAEVGYQVRFTDIAGPNTLVKVMTDGILLNALQRDKLLKAYDVIIIDEAHERSLNIDFLLGYLKQLLPKRPDLKVIVTSATIDPESFSEHFGGAPIIEVSGRTFPIEIRYRPIVTDVTAGDDVEDEGGDAERVSAGNKKPAKEPTANDYIDGIIGALKELEREAPGDVLVFLSGESEIRDAQEAIEGNLTSGALARGTEVLPLYGRLSAADQHRVFEPSKMAGVRRRVILATNVAETSLTVPGIKYVIDAGTARISRYSPRAKVQRLPIEAISQASANQRSGRCGRTSSGIAIRLYSEQDYESRPEFTEPEILRTNLASVILQATSLGLGDLTEFPFIQKPDARGVKDGLGLLRELGATREGGAGGSGGAGGASALTNIGRQLSSMPIEPRFARMVLESRNHGVTREVLAIVSGLTVQDPRERPLEKRPQADLAHARFADPTSDFLTLLNLWNYLEEKQRELSSSAFRRLCKAEFLNYLRVREWNDVYRQLKSICKPLGLVAGEPKIDPDGIHKSLLAGLLSHLGIKQLSDKKYGDKAGKNADNPKRGGEYLGSSNQKFVIFPGSALAKKPPAAIMSAELVETSRLFARMNAAINPAWAEALAGDLCKRTYGEPHWEKSQGAVVAYERVTLFGVPIVVNRRMQFSRIDASYARELFIRHALVSGEWDSPQQFQRENTAFVRELEELAERSRKPQHVPDEEDLFRFYDARVAPEVVSTRSFEGWWKQARREQPSLLTMTRENLLGQQEETLNEHDFPHEWHHHGQRLNLRYRFAPGATDDGVTVEVPLPLLAALNAEEFEWLVPGLRLELVTTLIKSLPKAIRKHVVPAGDWAAKALAALPEQPTGSLYTALAQTLQRLSGVVVSANDFDRERLTPNLEMTYRVLNARGKDLGTSNNLAQLQAQLADQSRHAVATVAQTANSTIERSNLETWDFDSLDSEIESRHGGNTVRAFPALVWSAKQNQVNIQLFSTQAEQRLAHPLGVRAMVLRTIQSPAKYVQEHLSHTESLALANIPYASFGALVDDILAAMVDREIERLEPNGLLFTKAQYELARQNSQLAVMDTVFETVALVAQIMLAARDANKAISGAKNMAFLGILSAEKAHIDDLLPKHFVSEHGLARLPRVLVYLKAIQARVEKLVENPNRDRLASVDLEQALKLFGDAGGQLPLTRATPPKLVRVRWLLEELRVSLFAQQLGTPETVSVQRIKKALAE